MEHPNLSSMPPEVFEAIACQLDLADIRNLRLTAIHIADKASGPHFDTFFHNKTVTFPTGDNPVVEDFAWATNPGRKGRLLRHLTLKYAVIGGDPGLDDPDHLTPIYMQLVLVFTNLGHLDSIALDIDDTNLRARSCSDMEAEVSLWVGTEQLFQLTCMALNSARFTLDRLDIFGVAARCGLACEAVDFHIIPGYLQECKSRLKQLSFGLSSASANPFGVYGAVNAFVEAPLLKLTCDFVWTCKNLEVFELTNHQHSIPNILALKDWNMARSFFNLLAPKFRPRKLQRLALQNITIADSNLATFVSHCPRLKDLVLIDVHLRDGTFHEVFDRLPSSLEHIHLQNLAMNAKNVHFNDTGLADTRTLERWGADARKEITYCLRDDPASSAEPFRAWLGMALQQGLLPTTLFQA
ncbi:hypothetical protein ANO11243_066650 [Dothideomycetidae sp. 11243]|nr:hypothetical protein ANO11243_066650 [fungal sp. No.11243]